MLIFIWLTHWFFTMYATRTFYYIRRCYTIDRVVSYSRSPEFVYISFFLSLLKWKLFDRYRLRLRGIICALKGRIERDDYIEMTFAGSYSCSLFGEIKEKNISCEIACENPKDWKYRAERARARERDLEDRLSVYLPAMAY